MPYIIDRFEGAFAICENEQGDFIKIEKNKLPASAIEGDILVRNITGYHIDKIATEKRRKTIQSMIEDIWKD